MFDYAFEQCDKSVMALIIGRAKKQPLAVILLATILLAGCGGGSSSSNNTHATPPSASIPVPERVQAKINSTASNVAATISINDGPEQAMTISNGFATFQADGLVPGSYEVVITFYQVAGEKRIVLARHISDVSVTAGQNASLGNGGALSYDTNFDEDGDDIPNLEDDDNDNDGINDENELAYGLDPFNPDSDGDGIGDADEVVNFIAVIPTAVESRVSSQGVTIAATIQVGDGAEIDMTLQEGAALFSIPGLEPGNHTVVITFYQTALGSRIELARRLHTATVVPGEDVEIDGAEYSTDFDHDDDDIENIADNDNDNDGIHDADEIAYLLNPFDADSDNDNVNDGAEIQLTTVTTPVPAAVLARVADLDIQIAATVKIGDAEELPMQIASNSASATIDGLLPRNTVSIVITFYQVEGGARMVLARHTNDSLTISAGQLSILGTDELAYSIAFDRDDDDINNIDDADNDNDGIDDVDEITYNKNPFNPDSDDDDIRDDDEVAIQVSGRGDHTCILLFSGKVRCWGFNEDGELGNGESGNNRISFAPVAVGTIDDITSVRASITHSCALRQGGNVSCWGSNAFNEIDDGDDDNYPEPVDVGSLVNATDIQLTLGVSCGVFSGNLACIGDISGLASNPVATFIGDATSSVGAGAYHSCIVADGTVSCYGAYLSGQLGDGNILFPPIGPATAQNINTAVMVAVGANHSCAQLQSGTIQCWGANGDAQLGDGTTSTRLTPVNVGTVVAATALAVGSNHNCALEAGLVRCWGSNVAGEYQGQPIYGQLGNGGNVASSANPVQVSGITNAISISAGESHSCAVLAHGRVMCWGSNLQGQLGSGQAPGDLRSSNVPVFVSGF